MAERYVPVYRTPTLDNAVFKEFFSLLGETGKAHFARCVSCGSFHHPPGRACTRCGSQDWRWDCMEGPVQVAGWSRVAWPQSRRFSEIAPFTLVVADYGGGVRVLSRVITESGEFSERLRLGDELRLVPVEFARGMALPFYELV